MIEYPLTDPTIHPFGQPEGSHPLIYLASPYSNPLSEIMEYRFGAVVKATAEIMHRYNIMIFSPIAHSHTIATVGGHDGGWERWAEFDLRMINACDEMWILTLEGWRTSKGVNAEITHARNTGKVIKLVHFFFTNPINFIVETYTQ